MAKKKKTKFKDNSTKRVRIKIIGIGGGGGNIVKELSKKLNFSKTRVEFVAVNTDKQALNTLPENLKKISFGEAETKGLGTGRDVLLGKKIAEAEVEKVKTIFLDDKDLYIVIASLGGGTGTGFAPVFSKVAKELNATTIGIFTLPFNFEGKGKRKEGDKALKEAESSLNASIVIPNEKIFKLVELNTPFNEALDVVNNHLAESLQGLLNTIYSSGLINIDWADIKTTIKGTNKKAYLNTMQAKLTDDLNAFTKKLLNSDLVVYDFKESSNVLFNIEGGKKISMQELTIISEKIHDLAENAKIIFGLTQKPKLKDEIIATVLATGGIKPKKKKKPKENIEDLNVDVNRRSGIEIKKIKEEKLKKEMEEEDYFEIPTFIRNRKKNEKS